MTICKLTDEYGKTYGGCQWGEGVSHKAIGRGKELCSNAVIHYYEDEYLASFANPMHANFQNPVAWEFQVGPEGKVAGDTLKSACKSGTTVRKISLPAITTEQRVEIAIRCVMLLPHRNLQESWLIWAEQWLSNNKRSPDAASVAADAAADAAANAASIDLCNIIHEVCKK